MACCRLELEAKESAERAARAEAERDTACHEAAMAKLEIEGVVNARAQMESELARVQRALAVVESARLRTESERGVAHEALSMAGEACKKEEEENSPLTDERLSLIMELGTIKDDFAAFWEKALQIGRRWRPSLTLAVTCYSIMAMVVVLLHTTYAGVSLKSRMECQTLQPRYLQSSSLTPDAP